MRRILRIVILLLVVASPALDAQRAAPAGARRMNAPVPVEVLPLDDQPRFRGEWILFGAALGALILAPPSALYAQGQCESPDCQAWKRGLGAGAAVGAVLGALFGLTWALPERTD